MRAAAIIFDVDGTLMDSNTHHLRAWMTALQRHGRRVEEHRVREHLGRGADNFVAALLGRQAEADDGDALRRAHTAEYLSIIQHDPPGPFAGVRELFVELRQRGVMTLIATSGTRREFTSAARVAGMELSGLVDRVVTAEEVERSNPAPDLVKSAVAAAGVGADLCVMVGDTPWDVRAATAAGVRCVAVACGRCHDPQQLHAAGAAGVYQDPADLLRRLNEVLGE